ncbi:MAG TPA: cytochrome o ubiquinol oxidase subunit I, partial [Paraburkholderia sp.]
TGDPWDGRTLEWATSSPPAVYNFAVIPHVDEIDAFAHMKEAGRGPGLVAKYSDIHMPSNTSAGFVIGMFSLVLGFAAVWHITWLAVLGFVGVALTVILKSFGNNDGYYIPAAKVREIEERRFGTGAAVAKRDLVAEEAV